MDPQKSTLIQALLGDLSGASSTWYSAILPYAQAIFFTLVGFQLLWSAITYVLGKRQGDEFISWLFILIIDVGFFYALMLHPDWVLDVINSFREIGRDASDLERLSPDAVVDTGLRLASAMLKTVSITGLLDFGVALILSALIAMAILASFAFIAARMVLIIAEIFFAVNISPILLAFSGLSATKYIATQYLGYVIGAGIQLLVTYLLIGAGLDIATEWANLIIEHGSDDINAFMLVGLGSALYAVLTWNMPKLVAGLATGAPQMSSGSITAGMAGVGAGFQLSRGFLRGSINTSQAVANTGRATNVNYTARREQGQSRKWAFTRSAGTTLGAVAASGVNSLVGRHHHRNTSERIWSSTAKIQAKKEQSTQSSSSEQKNS